jgi:hypothetical protein
MMLCLLSLAHFCSTEPLDFIYLSPYVDLKSSKIMFEETRLRISLKVESGGAVLP